MGSSLWPHSYSSSLHPSPLKEPYPLKLSVQFTVAVCFSSPFLGCHVGLPFRGRGPSLALGGPISILELHGRHTKKGNNPTVWNQEDRNLILVLKKLNLELRGWIVYSWMQPSLNPQLRFSLGLECNSFSSPWRREREVSKVEGW